MQAFSTLHTAKVPAEPTQAKATCLHNDAFRGHDNSRFVELMKNAVIPLVVLLNCCKGKRTGKYYVDSTKLSIYHNLRISQHKVFKGIAKRGKTSTGWFFGFKLHLVLNDQGEIMTCEDPGSVKEITDLVSQKLRVFLSRAHLDEICQFC